MRLPQVLVSRPVGAYWLVTLVLSGRVVLTIRPMLSKKLVVTWPDWTVPLT